MPLIHLPDFKAELDSSSEADVNDECESRWFVEDIRMPNLVQKYHAWRTERQRRRKLVRELSAFNDRELLELGFSRYDFPAIINGTYQR
jgi:uncharacterized protein YjiS (DUF1127 family)